MGIEYVEIRNLKTELLGIIDTAKSVIWHSVYYGVGDFEVYAPATPENVALLQVENLVTRPDDLEVGIIESVAIAANAQDGIMVTATGRFAKSLLERRLIYKLEDTVNTPTFLRGNVETEVRRVVKENAISCAFDSSRNMDILALGDLANIPAEIVTRDGDEEAEKQVSYQNLLEYTDAVLTEYGMSATVIMDAAAQKLLYVVYGGADRSASNTEGNEQIVFSKDFDNLTDSSYSYNAATEKNVALIGGEGEGLQRFYALVKGEQAGVNRREMWVDASSISRQYTADDGTEKTYSKSKYRAMLKTEGTQQLKLNTALELYDGTIDVVHSQWKYNRDFALGDIVTVQDNALGKFADVQLREVLESQNENGYSIEAIIQA